MYTKLELVIIFSSARNLEQLEKICATFQWLIENEFEEKSEFLNKTSHLAYRKLTNI